MRFDYSNEALLHPERRSPFKVVGALPLFDPLASDLSLENGWWLSNMSHLAYFDETPVEAELRKIGLDLVKWFDHQGTQGFVAKSSDFAILSFRGTEPDEFVDLLRVAEFSLKPFDGEAQVHGGFLKALDEVWTMVESALDEVGQVPVWYTGHSFGAALATLAAARRRPHALATFGSPRVGNREFVEALSGLRIFRYVNCSDIVTTLPPIAFGYSHVGRHVFLRESHVPVINPSRYYVWYHKLIAKFRYALSLPWLHWGQVKFRSFVDHTILNYSACIYENLLSGE